MYVRLFGSARSAASRSMNACSLVTPSPHTPLSSLLSMTVGVIKIRAPFTPEYFHHAAVLLPATKCPELNPTMSGVCPTTLPENVTSAAPADRPQQSTARTTAASPTPRRH